MSSLSILLHEDASLNHQVLVFLLKLDLIAAIDMKVVRLLLPWRVLCSVFVLN